MNAVIIRFERTTSPKNEAYRCGSFSAPQNITQNWVIGTDRGITT